MGLESQTKYWATPTSSENSNRTTQVAPSHGISHGLVLAGQAASWPIPNSTDAEHSGRVNSGGGQIHLPDAVNNWPTPKATDGTKGGPNQAGSKGDLTLPSATAQWPTPDANATERTNRSPSPGAAIRPTIALAAAQWPTPAARDHKGVNSEEHVLLTGGGRKHMDQLANFVAYSPLVQPTPDGEQSSPSDQNSRRHLNPLFGAWLMGWPSTWTIAEPHASSALETELWRSALQQRLSYLLGE